jgi:2-methylcitrate dehydratase
VTLRTSAFLRHEAGSEPAKWDPQTRETADHSLPYIFSRALQDGTITLDTFALEKVRDPAIRVLMNRVRVEEDPAITAEWPGAIQAKLDAVDRSGKTYHLHVKTIRGHESDPLTPEQIERKFLGLVEPALGREGAAAAFRSAWGTMDAGSFAAVLETFEPAGG